jgi:hypothetical protein
LALKICKKKILPEPLGRTRECVSNLIAPLRKNQQLPDNPKPCPYIIIKKEYMQWVENKYIKPLTKGVLRAWVAL